MTAERGSRMQKEMLTMQQAVCMIAMFLIGSSTVLGVGSTENDSWIVLIMAAIFGSVLTLMYARIMSLFPELNFYDIAEFLFGKYLGKFMTLLMTWYAIHLGALVLRNFSEFIQIAAMEETPQLAVMIATLVVTGYMVASGIETFGKWTMVALFLVSLVVVSTVILSIKQADFSNLLPIMNHDLETMSAATVKLFAFPFAELVVFLGLADTVKKSDNPYKMYLSGIFIGTLILLLAVLRNIVILGFPMLEKLYFPSYASARIINIAELFSRIEMSIFYIYILNGIVKISICLVVAKKGIKKLFSINKDVTAVILLSLIVLLVSKYQFKNVVEMISFIDIYQYYAFPFQIILPGLVWICAEIKAKKMKYIVNK